MPIKNFDTDNSPTNILKYDLKDKILIQKTTNGTKKTLENLDADRVFVTGFSNSKVLVNYLKTLNIDELNVLPSREKDDDYAVKEYIELLMSEKNISSIDFIDRIVNSDVAEKFFTDQRFNPKDIAYSVTEISDSFVMEVKVDTNNQVFVEKIQV